MADEQNDLEITSNNNNIVEEDELELSLSLRPTKNNNNNNNNLLETSRNNIQMKRDVQAIRRQEAKFKTELKRKAQVSNKNDPVLLVDNNNNNNDDDYIQQRCQKVPNLGFHVAVAPPPPWLGWNAGCFSGGFHGQNGKIVSDCASFSSASSSGVSDSNHQSISGPGANSSDAGSHSSHPHSQLPPPSLQSTSSQIPPSSSQLDLQSNDSNPNHSKPQVCESYSNKVGPMSSSTLSTKSPEGASTSSNTTCQQNGSSPSSDKDPNSTPRSIIPKEGKGETGKPPRPNGLMSQQKVLFSQMPCVSTTGNGPNGKTVTGFLYKYTKAAEVSIVCVCHGSSFSPAEFVEHAGGVDVENPLRHIRVVPFALG